MLDDETGGHPNTSVEDKLIATWSFACDVVDGSNNAYAVLAYGTYYAAIYPPNIGFSRLIKFLAYQV
jgi:hypothetical protein